MSGETKKRIPEVALALFSQNGYVGTSMSDIAKQLGITKPALYKHYAGKHEILERILKRSLGFLNPLLNAEIRSL